MNKWGQAVTNKKPRPGFAVFNLARGALFATVEIIAAIKLGGFLGFLLWGMAAWTIAFILLAVMGLAMLAAKGLDKPEDQV